MSKNEICSYQNAPTLDLTLKLKKKWSDVMAYLSKKWGDVNNLQNRLQIFLYHEGKDKEGMNCLADLSLSVGNSLGKHPALMTSTSVVPLIELHYHLKPLVDTESYLNTIQGLKSIPSTDPTLEAFCDLVKDQKVPPLYPSSTPSQAGKRSALSQESSRSVKQKVDVKNPDSGRFQHGSLEILNLPLFLNHNLSTSPTPPPAAIPNDDQNPDYDDAELEFLRDGLQAIADTPLSTLPAFDVTNDASKMYSKVVATAPSTNRSTQSEINLEMAPQFSSDTIAHLLDVMQDTVDSPVELDSESGANSESDVGEVFGVQRRGSPIDPLTSSRSGYFKTQLETIPEKNAILGSFPTLDIPITSESDSELSNYKAQYNSQPLFSSHPSRASPDQSSQISLVESETIQDSDGDAARFAAKTSPVRHKHSNADNSTTAYQTVSNFSIGIPKGIMKANKRKPHLKRINPTLISPLPSSQTIGSWA